MTAHHKLAIRMSQDAQKRAEHTELKEFTGMTITQQSGDIKKMARMNGKAKAQSLLNDNEWPLREGESAERHTTERMRWRRLRSVNTSSGKT